MVVPGAALYEYQVVFTFSIVPPASQVAHSAPIAPAILDEYRRHQAYARKFRSPVSWYCRTLIYCPMIRLHLEGRYGRNAVIDRDV